MGVVYQAKDKNSGQSVAVKTLHDSGDIERVERFLREARIMARLKHNGELMEMVDAATVPIINGCCNLYHLAVTGPKPRCPGCVASPCLSVMQK